MVVRSWGFSEKSKRRTLQKDDIQMAIAHTETFDFLQDVSRPRPPVGWRKVVTDLRETLWLAPAGHPMRRRRQSRSKGTESIAVAHEGASMRRPGAEGEGHRSVSGSTGRGSIGWSLWFGACI